MTWLLATIATIATLELATLIIAAIVMRAGYQLLSLFTVLLAGGKDGR